MGRPVEFHRPSSLFACSLAFGGQVDEGSDRGDSGRESRAKGSVGPGGSPAPVPRAVAMRSDHQRLLQAAGFHDILELDVTPAFAATAAARLAETAPYAEELARLEPARRLQTATSRPAQHAGRHPRRAAPRPPSSPEQEEERRRREVCTTQSPRRWPQHAPRSPTNGYSTDG